MGFQQFSKILYAVLFTTVASCSNNNAPKSEEKQVENTQKVSYSVPSFDADAAFRYLEAQVHFGPRAPETAAHDSCLHYLMDQLSARTKAVSAQTFIQPGYDGAQLRLTNVIASFNPQMTKRVLLCAHWDSRPRADQEQDKALQSRPIPGANDGASGVAVLLELARIFKDNPPPVGVDILFFDGEDYGKESDLDNYCLGAQYFAGHLPPGFHPACGILLDMVGDKEALFRKEGESMMYAGGLCNQVWGAAQAVNASTFLNTTDGDIADDHIPLNKAGIPTVDIIDAELVGNRGNNPRRKYWHTLEDTPDKCSPVTLRDVGATLLEFVYSVMPKS